MNTFTIPQEGVNLKQTLLDIEENYIDNALQLANMNVAEAARLLGLNRTTLVEKLRARYPERLSRRVRTASTEPIDPEGEFTFRRADSGRGYDIFYKEEKIAWKRTVASAEAYIKEKIDED